MTDLATLETWFKATEDATVTSRVEGERARDYFNGIQLTAEETAALKKRGQPPITYNFVRKAVEGLIGLEIQRRTDPKAFPRTPEHEREAEGATDAIRFVCDNADWDRHRTAVYENMLVEGFGGVEVVHEMVGDQVEVRIKQYPWDRLFADPFSRRYDYSDARFKGAVIWQDEADFEAENPGAGEDIAALYKDAGNDTFDDKPADIWVDAKRKRIRVVLMWYRDGKTWHWCRFIKDRKLDGGESPYMDDEGNSVCPLIMQSLYIDREIARYGVVRDMFDPQDEVNKRRSKALHQSTSRQTIGVKGAVDSIAEMKRELALPDGHVQINVEAFEDAARAGMKPVELVPHGEQSMMNFNLLQEAKLELERVTLNPVLQGESGESASGRAVLARQQGSLVEIAPHFDRLHHFTREVYRHIWMRIRQFWTEQRWVRVTDDERNVRFVGLNRPVTLQEKLSELPPEQVQQIALQMGLGPGDPRLEAVVGIDNEVARMDVDIVIEEVPDRVTLEGETFEALLKYAQTGTIPPQVLIEADPNLRASKKEKLLEMMQQTQPTPAEQAEMAAMQAGVMKTAAETDKTRAETMRLVSGT